MSDELFDARNALSVGNYDQAIAEASLAKVKQHKPDEVAAFAADKEAIMARAQIGLGQYDGVIAQLRSATHPLLKPVVAFAELKLALRSSPVPLRRAGQREEEEDSALPPAVAAALEKLTGPAEEQEVTPQNASTAILACIGLLNVYRHEAAIKLAWKWIRGLPPPQGSVATRQVLELRSIVCEGMLRLNRPDMAKHEVREMEKLDDESITTLMYTGMVALHEGQRETRSKESYTLALSVFKDAAMRCGNSVMLLNLQALAHMGLQQFEQAEKCLLDAMSIRSGDADTIANLAAVSAHLGKSAEQAGHYTTQASSMQGTWAEHCRLAGDDFDAAAAAFAPAAA